MEMDDLDFDMTQEIERAEIDKETLEYYHKRTERRRKRETEKKRRGIMIALVSVFIIAALAWTAYIFLNSSQDTVDSNIRSLQTTMKLQNVFKNVTIGGQTIGDLQPEKLNVYVRKCAHAFEYCVLAGVLTVIFKTLKIKNASVNTLFIVLLTAVADEFYQKSVQGRTSDVTDVIIDFAGALLMVIMLNIIIGGYNIIKYSFEKRKEQHKRRPHRKRFSK